MRFITSLFLGLFAVFSAPLAGAQDYPTRTVKIVVPYAPGGINDLAARILGNKLSEYWKQPVIIDNRAGAGGLIGAEVVAKAPADGYTLLMGAVGDYSVTYQLYAKYPLNPLRDFAPIALISDTPQVFVAPVNAPFNTLKEMMAYSNSKPGGLPYGSAGIGSLSHLVVERFMFETGTKMLHVPYKGGGPVSAALASGEILMSNLAASSAMPNVKGGRAKVLAVTTARRYPLAPDWPTAIEAGVPGFEASNWTALVAPAGTPRDIINKINADANRALKAPDVRDRFTAASSEAIAGSTPEETAARMRDDSERYGKLIKQMKITLD